MSDVLISPDPWTPQLRKILLNRILEGKLCYPHLMETRGLMQQPDLVSEALKEFPQDVSPATGK